MSAETDETTVIYESLDTGSYSRRGLEDQSSLLNSCCTACLLWLGSDQRRVLVCDHAGSKIQVPVLRFRAQLSLVMVSANTVGNYVLLTRCCRRVSVFFMKRGRIPFYTLEDVVVDATAGTRSCTAALLYGVQCRCFRVYAIFRVFAGQAQGDLEVILLLGW